jgi:hypothetical protein
VEGVRLLGPSKWAEIKKLTVSGICSLLTNRSAVDLKDKWRNLVRIAGLCWEPAQLRVLLIWLSRLPSLLLDLLAHPHLSGRLPATGLRLGATSKL